MQFKSILVAAAAFLFSGIASAAPPVDPEARNILANLDGESCYISCMVEAPYCMYGLTAFVPMTGLEPCMVKCCAFPKSY